RAIDTIGLPVSLGSVLFVFAVVSCARAVLERVNLTLQPALELRFGIALRDRLQRAIGRSDWSFVVSRRSTDLVHALTREIDRASASAYQVLALFTGLVVSAVYVAVAVRLSAPLTLLVAAIGGGLLWLARRRTTQSGELGQRHAD